MEPPTVNKSPRYATPKCLPVPIKSSWTVKCHPSGIPIPYSPSGLFTVRLLISTIPIFTKPLLTTKLHGERSISHKLNSLYSSWLAKLIVNVLVFASYVYEIPSVSSVIPILSKIASLHNWSSLIQAFVFPLDQYSYQYGFSESTDSQLTQV